MKKTLLPFCLILLAAAMLAGCSEKEETPKYKTTDGLFLSTSEALKKGPTPNILSFYLVFYCNLSFPFFDISCSTATIYNLSEPCLYLRAEEEYLPATSISIEKANTWVVKWKYMGEGFPRPGILECGEEGYMMDLEYYFPGEGQYDFFLRFEQPEAGLYYQTPNYRLTITTDPQRPTASFTSIEILN